MAELLIAAGFGVCAGTLAALLGVGGGIVMVPFLVLVADVSQQTANATSLLVTVPTALVGTLTLRRRGLTNVPASLGIGAFGVAGAVAGSSFALVVSSSSLRFAFAVLLAVAGIRTLLHGTPRRSAGTG
jgi:uncharacterized protein